MAALVFKSRFDIARYTCQTVTETYKKESGLTKGEHEFIINECSRLIIEELIRSSDGFKLPERLGTLVIIGSPANTPIKQRHLTTKDKKIIHRNSNTGGIMYKVTYLNKRKSEGRYENSKLFTFRTSVPLRKAIKNSIDRNKTSQWSVLRSYMDRYYKNTNDVPIPREEWLVLKEERRKKYLDQKELNRLKDIQ